MSLSRRSRRKKLKKKHQTPGFLSKTASGRTPKATSRFAFGVSLMIDDQHCCCRYVSEPADSNAKKTKDPELTKKALFSPDHKKSPKELSLKTKPLNPADLIKVPDLLNKSDDNLTLTPPVLEPIYPDDKVCTGCL